MEQHLPFTLGTLAGDAFAVRLYRTNRAVTFDVWDVNNQRSYLRSNTFFNDDNWVHVVATSEGSTMKIYKDGVLVSTKSDGDVPAHRTRQHHYFGTDPAGRGHFDGTIAYMRFWHGAALQGEQVSLLYARRGSIVIVTSL